MESTSDIRVEGDHEIVGIVHFFQKNFLVPCYLCT